MINIFDVRTGKVMRDFKGSADDFSIGGTGGVTGVSWPVFRWFFFPYNFHVNQSSPVLWPHVTIFTIFHYSMD